MNSHEELTPADYNKLAAEFPGIEPPPVDSLTVSAIVKSQEQKNVAIPGGYRAKKVSLIAVGLHPGDCLEVVVGKNRFTLKDGENEKSFKVDNEERAVPVACFLNFDLDSSPVFSHDVVLNLEIYCECSTSLIAQWQLKTFNAIKDK